MLTGTFARTLDEKQRIAIPKSLRDAMGCQDGGVVYLAPGTDGSLSIYTEDSFSRLAARLAEASPTEEHVRAFLRLFYARAQRIELDRQGRMRISGDLAELCSLGRDVILLGVHDHLELWSPSKWQSYLAEKKSQFDAIAEAALGRPQ